MICSPIYKNLHFLSILLTHRKIPFSSFESMAIILNNINQHVMKVLPKSPGSKNLFSRSLLLGILMLTLTYASHGQDSYSDLKMTSDWIENNPELGDIIRFEGIEYLKLKFTGEELKDKSYQLTVKEFWDGKMRSDTTVFSSADLGIETFEKVNDSIFSMKVIAKHTDENKLKMQFRFPRFSILREFDAIDSEDYSLRNIAQESSMEIGYGEKFYLLAYILPYEREDGSKSWCDVGISGRDIENWGEKFGIKHYLVFEMLFE